MRILCIEEFNKEYGLNDKLKTKKKGRNKDYYISEMDNYEQMQEQLEKNQEKLEIASKKAIELDNSSKEVKDIINDLKTTLTSKEKYVLKKEDKDKLVSYINSVSKTNEEFKQIQTLSVTLSNVDEELKEENYSLKSSIEHLINKFTNLIKLIKNKIFSKHDTREKYMEFSRDLYTHGIIEDKEIRDIKDNYDYCQNRDNGRNKDDFEIEI